MRACQMWACITSAYAGSEKQVNEVGVPAGLHGGPTLGVLSRQPRDAKTLAPLFGVPEIKWSAIVR